MDSLRAEADAAEKERQERRDAADRLPARARASRPAREPFGKVRLVWSVRNQRGEEVSFYPYSQQAEARAEAERLYDETERAHFVTQAEKRA